jgi:multiple sugar transport system permease protein
LKQPRETFVRPIRWLFIPESVNYEEVFFQTRFFLYLFNSLAVSGVTLVISITLGLMAGYGFSRFKFKGNYILRIFSLIPQVLPPIMIMVPGYVFFAQLGLVGTKTALVLSHLTFVMPLCIWILTGFFDDIPSSIGESALIDGCPRIKALWLIEVPMVKPGIAAAVVLSMMYSWNEFLYASIFSGKFTKTLPVMITSFMTNKAILWGRIAAAGSLVLIPILIFALFFQKYLISGLTAGGVKE